MLTGMSARLSAVRPVLSARHVGLFEEAIAKLEELFAVDALPAVVAHRDFVPWNIRHDGGKLFIFDWEYATDGYTPTYDVFHYCLMPIVLRRPPGIRDVVKVLDEVGSVMLGAAGWRRRALSNRVSSYSGTLLIFACFTLSRTAG